VLSITNEYSTMPAIAILPDTAPMRCNMIRTTPTLNVWLDISLSVSPPINGAELAAYSALGMRVNVCNEAEKKFPQAT